MQDKPSIDIITDTLHRLERVSRWLGYVDDREVLAVAAALPALDGVIADLRSALEPDTVVVEVVAPDDLRVTRRIPAERMSQLMQRLGEGR